MIDNIYYSMLRYEYRDRKVKEQKQNEKNKKLSGSKYLASFNSYNELEDYFNDMYNKTENIRKKIHFVNFQSSLMEVITKMNGKDIKLNQKELMLLEALEK